MSLDRFTPNSAAERYEWRVALLLKLLEEARARPEVQSDPALCASVQEQLGVWQHSLAWTPDTLGALRHLAHDLPESIGIQLRAAVESLLND